MKLNLNLRPVWTILIAVLVMAAVYLPISALAEGGEPLPGTVVGVGTYTYYPSTASTISGTGEIVSAAPRTIRGLNMNHVRDFNSADVFVTLDISGTGTITVTPQVSADQSDWTDATYTYIADTLAQTTVQTTTVLTSTGVTTATSTLNNSLSSSSTPTEQTYQIVLSADGTDYLRMPIAGEYLRFTIDYSFATTGTITPTIKASLRNN